MTQRGNPRRHRESRSRKVRVYRCASWADVGRNWQRARKVLKLKPGEEPWYRGVRRASDGLQPSLFWRAKALSQEDCDEVEQDLFFEFQARAEELHERHLTDWDYLFFMRHHDVPTRILDWTDSFGVALYFALLARSPRPCIWILNPWKLNEKTWGVRDLVQPRFLGETKKGFRDYGDLLISRGNWRHDGPVAIYPLQISPRMRAQRGWFTIHGNDRRPLEKQYGEVVVRIELSARAVREAREFLEMAGLKPYTVFPDLDHLGAEVRANAMDWRKTTARP